MNSEEEDMLGRYTWQLVPLDSSEVTGMDAVGQQAKVITTVESIVYSFLEDLCTYENGRLYINVNRNLDD